MKIKLLLQPIAPPPQGLEKLQQALLLQHKVLAQSASEPLVFAAVVPSGHSPRLWQAAAPLLVGALFVGVLLVGVLLSVGSWPDDSQPLVALTLPSAEVVVKQSSLVALPSSDPKVKMYWAMSEG